MPLVKSLFGEQPIGAVALVRGSRIAHFSLLETDPKITSTKAIITGFAWQDGVNVQFTHTMGDDIYMNIFGNRMGTLTINGVAFASVARAGIVGCDSPPTVRAHGIISVIDWYRENRVSTKQSSIKVTVGGEASVAGYLISATYRIDDPEKWMMNYQLQIATVPRS
jgi:hypothetical protein